MMKNKTLLLFAAIAAAVLLLKTQEPRPLFYYEDWFGESMLKD
jgi:hypothetical protein